ncbi:MAG: hypothetical protein VYB65_12470 [Myxococcota bacterium]|nr:hypothetical protein [Myxococcota bacterium]
MNRVLVFVSVLMVGLPALAGAAGDAATLSKEHYDAYCRYKNFVGDEATLKKYKSVDRAHKAFARAERMKSKALTELIARGDTVGSCEAFKGVWEQRLKKELAAIAGVGDVIKLFDEQEFASRIDWSEVNASNSAHVVVWVSWKFKDLRFIEEEAALVGAAVAKAIPAVGTLSIWAHKGAKKRMVFEAKTYGTNLGYMKADQASTFGKTRYWRFFENIRFHKVLRRQLKKGEELLVSAKTKPDAPAEAAKAN